ncbi:N-methyl-D-aspartate receptor glutamate-binding subunit [Plasmopara halstedii]|uniref:N-methyl-D-aspartate receptor glutamate-binding subunit n=1 Tax=Plasmopara halstedii TaxID=4781 RepID=A0A0N7L7P2_PLAHL|nr:N-methyl-D-aspartate receptor glutamate-binding subunit [Plasmopara halstedii]CEG47627.1 N-methyl-D-aspartate receptor glutamate-binding subunit [Plasmopara halstedii]|eukprot:XP_024583996.1 N-methyl-D-aspartate receptor glutamate-binding subunit [Plasmopara halstedii]
MEMASDDSVESEDMSHRRLEAGESSFTVDGHNSGEHAWASPMPNCGIDRLKESQDSSGAVSFPDRTHGIVNQGSVRKLVSRMTKLFHEDDKMDPTKHKAHYRRGSILMKHLEDKKVSGKATETDMKFFDMVKKRFDANFMESRTIISLSVFQTGSNPMDDPFAVIHMPVEIQQGFRRKLFTIFTIQLLAVVLLVAFLSYLPPIAKFFEKTFSCWQYVIMTFVIMILALLWLYLVKYRFPLNFMVLGAYSITQSVFFTAFDCYLKTKASLFMFSFLFGIMGVATLLCTIITKRSFDENIQPTLISYPVVLIIAFFAGFVTSLFIYFFYMMDVVSPLQFSASLAAMMLLIMWFAYDASCMNERLSPDEYMQGDCACYGTADIIPIGHFDVGNNDDDSRANGDEGDG